METVENFLRQGAADSQLVSDLLDRDPAGLKPATQYEGVFYGLEPLGRICPAVLTVDKVDGVLDLNVSGPAIPLNGIGCPQEGGFWFEKVYVDKVLESGQHFPGPVLGHVGIHMAVRLDPPGLHT